MARRTKELKDPVRAVRRRLRKSWPVQPDRRTHVVLSVEANGKYIRASFVRDDGHPAVAEYKRIGWSIAPPDVAAEFDAILREAPRYVYGRRRRSAASEG